jgi:hypothetical protein
MGSYGSIICTPSVDGQPVLFGEKGREKLHVGRVRVNVNHTPEPDVFFKPDRPTQTILNKNEEESVICTKRNWSFNTL